MKHLKYFLSVVLAALALAVSFTSCNKDDDDDSSSSSSSSSKATYELVCTDIETNWQDASGSSLKSYLLSELKKSDTTFEAESDSQAKQTFDTFESSVKQQLKGQAMPAGGSLVLYYSLKKGGSTIATKTIRIQ